MKMNYSLSGQDIIDFVDKPINIITFDEIAGVDSLDDLFKKHDKHFTNSVLILYKTSDEYGHWTALNKTSADRYDFFDSYGEPYQRSDQSVY